MALRFTKAMSSLRRSASQHPNKQDVEWLQLLCERDCLVLALPSCIQMTVLLMAGGDVGTRASKMEITVRSST